MGQIILSNMEFFAHHGVYLEEKRNGNNFTVSMVINGKWESASESDDLKQAVDYSQVYKTVESLMKVPSDLLEHLSRRLNKEILDKFDLVDSVETTVCKLNPPIEGDLKQVCVKDTLAR